MELRERSVVTVRWVAIALCCGFAVLYLATIRPAESWGGGDFALYIMHAQNILAWRDYAATPFLFNPARAIMSPAAYPPGYPLLLAPVVALFGPSVRAAAGLSGLFMAASLYLLFRLARPALGARWALLLIVLAGLSPVLANHRDAVESDVPFLFWCLLGLLSLRDGRMAPLAIAVLMAPLTRTVGFVLPVAMLAELGWRAWRRPGGWDAAQRRALAVVPGCVVMAATVAALVIGRLLQADSGTYLSYFDRVPLRAVPANLAGAVVAYLSAVVELFGLSFGRVGNAAALLLLLGAIGWGFLRGLRHGMAAAGAFVLLYGAVLLVYPVHAEPVRYALPILPLLLIYALGGLQAGLGRCGIRRGGAAMVAGVFLVLYGPFFATHNLLRPLPHALDSAASRAMLAALDRAVPADAVVLADNPRAVALLTGRRAVSWPERPDAAGFWDSAARYHAGYVLLSAASPAGTRARVDAIVHDSGARLRPVFENAAFRLLRIADTTPGAAPGR